MDILLIYIDTLMDNDPLIHGVFILSCIMYGGPIAMIHVFKDSENMWCVVSGLHKYILV